MADKSIMAARAAANGLGATRSTGRAGSNLLARVETVVPPRVGAVRNRKATKLTATQRDSQGRSSAWNRSPSYWTDPKWGRTVSGR